MASRTCVSCLRTFQRQLLSIPQAERAAPEINVSRAFTTTGTQYADQYRDFPELSQRQSTFIPPVTPERLERGAKVTTATPSTSKIASQLQKIAARSTEVYSSFGATEVLYKECARHADYSIPQATKDDEEVPKTESGEDLGIGEGWWHTELGLQPTFSTWSQVTMLHLYLLSARFRCFPAGGSSHGSQIWQQHLIDHFFYDAENRMTITHNMHARGTRNKYLKDLYVQWRGLLAAYDEGIVKGDAVLAAAIWRNVFKAGEDIDVRQLSQIVSYMRRTLKGLDAMPDAMVMGAQLEFKSPRDEAGLVAIWSKMMDLPFEKAPGKPPPPSGKSIVGKR